MSTDYKPFEGFTLKCHMTKKHLMEAVSLPAFCFYALPIKDAALKLGIKIAEARVRVDARGRAHITRGQIRYRAEVPNYDLVRRLDKATSKGNDELEALRKQIKPHAFTLEFVPERIKQQSTDRKRTYDRKRQRNLRTQGFSKARPRRAHLAA